MAQDEYKIIKESKEPFVIRIKKPKQDINNNKIDSFIIMRADNTPTENFASACSDMLNDISLIICKEEQLDNIQKQIYIKSSLGYEQKTQYIYLPTILNSEDKSTSIKWLFEEGFIPDAILNYLVLIGNSNTPKEIFTLPEAIEWFDLNSISKEPIRFDISKLRFINREHLKLIDDKRLSALFGFADADIGKLAKLYLGECSTINELEAKIRPIFKPKNFDGEWGKQMRTIENIIAQAPAFETLDELKKHITNKSGLRDENLSNPLQILLTGNKNSPELNKIYPLIKSYILEVAS
jgi:glutamyl-tRNA synthetase